MRVWAGMVTLLGAGLSSLGAAQEKAPATPVIERISQADFKKLMEADKVLVVDVRGADAYKAGHIPGALSIPLADLDQRLPELKSAKKPIVTYCT